MTGRCWGKKSRRLLPGDKTTKKTDRGEDKSGGWSAGKRGARKTKKTTNTVMRVGDEFEAE